MADSDPHFTPDDPEPLQKRTARCILSGKEQNHLGNQLDRELKRVIYRKYSEYENAMKPAGAKTAGLLLLNGNLP